MNTTGIGVNPLDQEGREDGAGLAEEHRRREAERFAQAILPSLLAYSQPLTAPFIGVLHGDSPLEGKNDGEAAKDWRRTDGALTAENTAAAGSTRSAGQVPGGDDDGRLVAHIEMPDFGRVSLVVERSGAGLKVLLAVDDAFAAASAEARRGELLQALRATGLVIASVTIAQMGPGGIVLAQTSASRVDVIDTGATSNGTLAESKDHKSPSNGRSRRRLNLTG